MAGTTCRFGNALDCTTTPGQPDLDCGAGFVLADGKELFRKFGVHSQTELIEHLLANDLAVAAPKLARLASAATRRPTRSSW